MSYQVMPALAADEYQALKDDIAVRGPQVPIEKDEHGNILDGHHRVRACAELGITSYPSIIRPGLTEDEKIEHALTLNLARRHLSKEQRQQLVITLRQRGWSSPRIAALLGVSDQTILNDLATSKRLEVPLPARTIGKDGKSRPSVFAKTAYEARRALAALAGVPVAALPEKVLDVNRVARIGREYRAVQRGLTPVGDVRAGQVTLLYGDLRERGGEIPDASVDLIFTDPPYPEEYLPLWSALSALAARVLKPGALLVSYSGPEFLPDVLPRLSEHLRYLTCGALIFQGQSARCFPLRIINEVKPLLFYRQPSDAPLRHQWFSNAYRSRSQEKAWHPWQQAIGEARYYIDKLTQPRDTVLDPFLGSGTTGVAAVELGRQFIGIDCDPLAFATAQERLRSTEGNTTRIESGQQPRTDEEVQ
jgi:ParB-like chromosome segregation protein Spo0J